MKIAFEALIKKYTPITLLDGSKQVSLTLRLNDENVNEEILNAIGSLYNKTPDRVMVAMMEKGEVEK